MARGRKQGNRDLPSNLYRDKKTGHYKWRNPLTKKSKSLGKDKDEAKDAAIILNSHIIEKKKSNLAQRIFSSKITLAQFIDARYWSHILPERRLKGKPLSYGTLDGYRKHLNAIKDGIGHLPIDKADTRDISDHLIKLPLVTSNRRRSLLSNIFKYARAEGLAKHNPVVDTIKRNESKKRERCTFELYEAIYNHPETEKALKNSMKLALITLQRRGDLVNLEWPKNGKLNIIQQKTGAGIEIIIGGQLKTAIEECRDNIISPYIIHRLVRNGRNKAKNKRHPTQVTPDWLTKEFAKIRDRTGLCDHLEASERPSFHELRSLGKQLYNKAGMPSKDLAGWMTEAMEKRYDEGYGIDWKKAESL